MKQLALFTSLIFSLTLIACGGGGGSSFSLLADTESFVQSSDGVSNKVDILFVINSEPSMSSFQDELASSFSTFMQIFQNKDFDFKIAVITASAFAADPTLNGYTSANDSQDDFNHEDGTYDSGMPILLPNDPNLFTNFTINSHPVKNTAGQDGRSFSSFRQALQSSDPENANFLRPDAYLAVIIVDNQDDFSDNSRCIGCSMNQRYNNPNLDTIQEYVDFLDNLTGSSSTYRRYNVSAMTQTGTPCQGGTTMTRIMDLVNQTGGVLGDICQADFGQSLADISSNIATLSTQFYLDRIPDESSIVIHVDGVLIPNDGTNGWTYDSVSNSIVFHGSAVPVNGAVIDVDFDPLYYGT